MNIPSGVVSTGVTAAVVAAVVAAVPALQTTVSIDVGAIFNALAQPITIVTTAIVAWFALRRAKKAEKVERDAAKAEVAAQAAMVAKSLHDKVAGVHMLVNDQLTHEKSGRLSLMKANRLVLDRLTSTKRKTQEKALMESLDSQIAELEEEIKRRNDAAATLTKEQK